MEYDYNMTIRHGRQLSVSTSRALVPEELWVRKLERDIDSLSVAQVREVSQDKKLKRENGRTNSKPWSKISASQSSAKVKNLNN